MRFQMSFLRAVEKRIHDQSSISSRAMAGGGCHLGAPAGRLRRASYDRGRQELRAFAGRRRGADGQYCHGSGAPGGGFGAGNRQFRREGIVRCRSADRRKNRSNAGGCRRFRKARPGDRASGRSRRATAAGSGRGQRGAGRSCVAPGAVAHRSRSRADSSTPTTCPRCSPPKPMPIPPTAQARQAEADAQRYANLLKTGDVSQSAYEKAARRPIRRRRRPMPRATV